MSQKLITLPISDELYERLQETAEASDRTVEEVLLETIDVTFQTNPDLVPLEALVNYSNEQLWGVVYNRLSWSQSLRLRDLSAKNKEQELTEAEEAELNRLIDLVDQYMLLRSEALLLLKQRGQNIDDYLRLGTLWRSSPKRFVNRSSEERKVYASTAKLRRVSSLKWKSIISSLKAQEARQQKRTFA